MKFQPVDELKIVQKYDHNDDNGVPDGTGFIGLDRAASGGVLENVLTALY